MSPRARTTATNRRPHAPARRLLIDLAPVRENRDFRRLVAGELVSALGTQLTVVAVMFQVYAITGSSLYVGLVSLAEIGPLIAGSLIGGAVADSIDRRRLLLVVECLMALSSAALALNADRGAALWPLFVFPACIAALSGFDGPARSAIIVGLLPAKQLSSANAMLQALAQLGMIVGPAAGGLLLAGVGVRLVYWIDVATFLGCLAAVATMAPQPPPGDHAPHAGLRSILDGIKFAASRKAILGVYLIDVNATVLGLPRVLFPALAAHTFGGGPSTLGLLYSAPAAGALAGATTTGWVNSIERQGRAVTIAVILWGAAITAFGIVAWLPTALGLLALAGWADVISAIFRNTIVQTNAPGHLQGRLASLQMAVVNTGPRLGDIEASGIATAIGNQLSIITGGLGCITGALALARLLPDFYRQRRRPSEKPPPGATSVARRSEHHGHLERSTPTRPPRNA
jgi:ENTS family enterobactin (siderophore) exporter